MELTLAAVSGISLSLLFEFIPGFNTWYGKRTKQAKQLVMLGLLALTAVAIFLLSCFSPYVYIPCTEAGGWELVGLFVVALMGNQAGHRGTKHIGHGNK